MLKILILVSTCCQEYNLPLSFYEFLDSRLRMFTLHIENVLRPKRLN